MITCGSLFPAYPSFVHPVPRSTPRAASRPAIFLLACGCHHLLRASWGQGWAARGRGYLTSLGRAALSVGAGEPGRQSSSERAAASVSGYHVLKPGRQSPCCPPRPPPPSLPPPHSCPHPTTSSPPAVFPREAKVAFNGDNPARPAIPCTSAGALVLYYENVLLWYFVINKMNFVPPQITSILFLIHYLKKKTP